MRPHYSEAAMPISFLRAQTEQPMIESKRSIVPLGLGERPKEVDKPYRAHYAIIVYLSLAYFELGRI